MLSLLHRNISFEQIKKIMLAGLILSLIATGYIYYAWFYRAETEPLPQSGETSTTPLWSLDDFRRGLQHYKELYQASMVAPRAEVDDGTYVIPGLRSTRTLAGNDAGKMSVCTSMTPQGIAVSDRYIFVSAYCHTKKHNSVIYILNRKNHKFIKEIVLPGKPHAGSLAYDEQQQNLWVCGNAGGLAQANALTMEDIEAYKLEQTLQPISYTFRNFVLQMRRSSFMTYEDEHIYIGYFHSSKNGVLNKYPIEDDGNLHRSLLEFNGIEAESGLAIESVSIPKQAQGMAFYRDKLFLSQSLGILPSRLVVFDKAVDTGEYLDDRALLSMRLPRMLEQVYIYKNELYMIFESGAYAYRGMPMLPIDRILKVDVREFLKNTD